MAYYIRQLKDNQGNIILPASRAEGIFFSDNTKLSSIMSATSGVVNKAMGDKNGKDIATYLADASIDDHKLTLTKGDGTPVEINIPDQDTTYEEATTSTAGLMSAADKTKLNGIEAGANKYTHPSYTSKASGLYKVTVDATGHVSAAAAVEKSDITALGIPGQDTTYKNATQSQAGLMSAADKTKLDNIPTSVLGYASNWGADADDLPARPIA